MKDEQHPTGSKRQRAGEREQVGRKRHGSRYRARARAVDLLFEAEFRDVDPVEVIEEHVELAQDPTAHYRPVMPYTQTIVTGVAENLDAIDDTIAEHLSEEWKLERLPAVDRAVLRVSTWELMFNPEVPREVATVEGVELASEYSHVKAQAYVHAVLDRLAERWRAPEQEKTMTTFDEDTAATAEVLADQARSPEVGDQQAPEVDSPVGEDAAERAKAAERVLIDQHRATEPRPEDRGSTSEA
ncbi:transcription antitermination factor NusB [Corynebacterium heidelbergense]|uniref:Transcription antitermination protein NusB n=1 Tax=Corynebacterium heidelbergense TaxID=2055947 RepID=A0A364V924_9CORY|nr:transcription antitermination factor NusB [Corynebacterium heidelbergense]RAV33160.1 transcription antitermination factor NusB [Corynebacterium heidelbergense]